MPIWADDADAVLASAEAVRIVGTNRHGGETFEIELESARYFLKRQAGHQGGGLDNEVAKIGWAASHGSRLAVCHANLDEPLHWFVTRAISGQPLSNGDFAGRPDAILDDLATGLRRFHDMLPANECPWERRFDQLADLGSDGDHRSATSTWWSIEHRNLSVEEVRERLRSVPTVDELVVCHGDPFFSNFIHSDIDGEGCFIDLDLLGRGDRWADLAAVSLAIDRRLGTDDRWIRRFLHSYGVEPDDERLAYYRLCWDLESDGDS